MAYLAIKEGKSKGAAFQLKKEITRIGRNPTNDVVLTDDTVSRFHAEVENRDGHYYVRDLNSSHGTFVNNVRNNYEILLEDDDEVLLGTTKIVFKREELETAVSKAKAAGALEDDTPLVDMITSQPFVLEGGKTIAFSMSSMEPAGKDLTGRHWEMLTRVADATMSVFNLEDLLGKLMDMLFEVFNPDRGAILLYEGPEGKLTPKVSKPAEGDLTISHTIINHAVQNRISLLIGDISADQRFSAAKSIVAQSIRSAICSPLVCKDKVLGVIYIDAQSRKITYKKQDLALLNIIAANAAISIENTLLIAEKLKAERLAAIGIAIAGISHYVKNIIMGIVGSEQLIDQGIKSDDMEMIKSMWPIQKRSTKKISTLVQDMLSYSKEREPDWEKGNFNDLLREIYEDQLPRAEKANVALQLQLEENLPPSEFDHKGLHDTILNIVGNAIEACSDLSDASVVLRSFQTPESELAVWIMDNGPGIPEDIQIRIFEPFFSTKGSKGTGLGLAVARKTVEEHEGKLVLESIPGRGTTFKIHLPPREPGAS